MTLYDDVTISEHFKAQRESRQQKRASNRESSQQILKDYQVNFTVKNNGSHLVINHNNKIVDFWPGTGLWSIRSTGKQRRGVFPLIRWIQS